jgi:hypothetical protein
MRIGVEINNFLFSRKASLSEETAFWGLGWRTGASDGAGKGAKLTCLSFAARVAGAKIFWDGTTTAKMYELSETGQKKDQEEVLKFINHCNFLSTTILFLSHAALRSIAVAVMWPVWLWCRCSTKAKRCSHKTQWLFVVLAPIELYVSLGTFWSFWHTSEALEEPSDELIFVLFYFNFLIFM